MTRILVEEGGERWLGWARRRLRALGALRRDLRLPKMMKQFVPEQGTKIWISSSEFGDWIRITGGKFMRMWAAPPNSAANRSVKATFGGEVKLDEAFTKANWSKDYSTFVAFASPNMSIRWRAEGEQQSQAVPSVVVTPTGDFMSGFPFWRNTNAWVDEKGEALVFEPATPTFEKILVAAKWNENSGLYDLVDIGLPPTHPVAIVDGEATLTLDAPAGVYSDPDLVGDDRSHEETFTVAWRRWVNPYKPSDVYVEAIAPRAGTRTVLASTNATHYEDVEVEYVRHIAKYDVLTGEWSAFATDVFKRRALFRFGFTEVGGGGAGVTPASLTSDSPIEGPFQTLLFSPDEAPHVLSYDNRTTDNRSNVDLYTYTDSTPGTEGGFVDRTLAAQYEQGTGFSRASSGSIVLDAAVWIADVSIDTAAAGAFPALNVNSARGVSPVYLGEERRGAVSSTFSGAGREGTIWVYQFESPEYVQAAVETPKFSKSGRWMHRANKKVYLDGDEVYDGTDDTYTMHLASFETDDVFFASYKPPGLVTRYGGTLHSPLAGDVDLFTNNVATDEGGTGVYTIPDGTFIPLSALEPGFGSPLSITVNFAQTIELPGGTPKPVALKLVETTPGALPRVVELQYEVAELIGTDLFPHAQIAPDEFVV